jgi:hypothetical protein
LRIISPGVDYLRLTVRAGSTVSSINEVWQELQEMRFDQGHPNADWRFQQFLGNQIGEFSRGFMESHACFDASGGGAHLAIERIKGIGFDGNITRLDVKADVEGTPGEVEGPCEFDSAYNSTRHLKSSTRRVKCGITRGSDGGDTATVGARDSDTYLRVYHAHVVHPEQYNQRTIRFEMETKGERARELYSRIQTTTDARHASLLAVVGRLEQIKMPQPCFQELHGFEVKLHKPISTHATKLKWLSTSVRAVVRVLLEAGLHHDVENALGLPHGSLSGDS